MAEQRKTWSGLALGGPVDGQKIKQSKPTFKVAVHRLGEPIAVGKPLPDLDKVTDIRYVHDAAIVRSADGGLVEFGIWRMQSDTIEGAVLRLFDFFSERKTWQNRKTNSPKDQPLVS